jgi:CRISPR-associated protein Csh2
MPVKTGEILFVKCVKCGIPNRDPLRDSDARRLFGEEDGRISLSDVSIKRDVRDYVDALFPDGGDGTRFVFVRKVLSDNGKTLLGRDGLAKAMLVKAREGKTAAAAITTEQPTAIGGGGAKAKQTGGDDRTDMFKAAFDMRVFGAVFSVSGKSFNQTGPVQFGWGHSLHPVETRYTQGTVCMPSKDTPAPAADGKEGEEKGKTQGTIWTQYQLPFAVFAMPGVVNATIAGQTLMTDADLDLLLAGLWKGTLHRQARGRGIQQPLMLLHVEYADPFFRIGFLEEGLKLLPGRDADGRARWMGQAAPTELGDVTLDVTTLAENLNRHKGQVARARLWVDPLLKVTGKLPAEAGVWPEGGLNEPDPYQGGYYCI